MNLQDKIQKITCKYPYFEELLVSDSASNSTLHPAIKIGLATAIESFSGSDFKRLILLLPRREDYALWISFLAALWAMKNDFELNYKKAKLSSGNKIKLNNCVVEYIKEELSSDGRTWLMWVRCSNGNYAFRLDREYTVVPFNTGKPLNKMERVIEAYKQSNIVGFPLDELLSITANGNFNIFRNCVVTVSRRSKLERFIDTYALNGTNLKKLIMVGKLNHDGIPVCISTDAADNTMPTCIVSSDMFRLSSYVENFTGADRPLTGVVIDGAGFCDDNLQILDDYLFPNDIPVTVVADYSDRRSLKNLLERGFKVLHLNEQLLPNDSVSSIVKNGPFRFIEKNLNNSRNLTINIETTMKDQNIVNLYQRLFSLENTGDPQSVDQIVRECWVTLLSITLDISKKWHVPPKSYFMKSIERLDNAELQLKSRWMWLPEEVKNEFKNVFLSIRQIIENFESATCNKLINIEQVLKKSVHIRTIMLTTDETEARAAADFWSKKLFAKTETLGTGSVNQAIEFTPFSKLEEKRLTHSKTGLTAISGWPGRERFLNILSLFFSPRICLFLYEPERKWFDGAYIEWKRVSGILSDNVILKKMFNISSNDAIRLINDKTTPHSKADDQENEVEDIFFKLRSYQLSRYISTSQDADTIKTRYVKFSDNRFAFMAESHMHYVVSELMQRKSASEIPRRKTGELKIGDYILFLDSDRNIIRDIADRWLERENKSHMRDTAALWRQSLMKKYDRLGRDVSRLSVLLSSSGCSRTPTTLRKWLFDDDIIGPQDYERDLRCIAEATGDNALKEKLLEVKIAIGNLRSIHLQAASLVRERCIAKLSSTLDSKNISQQDAMILDVEDIKARILRVEEIGSEWLRVKHSEINSLHVLEHI